MKVLDKMIVVVEIYIRLGCGYCFVVKLLLVCKKVDFIEFDVVKNFFWCDEMYGCVGVGFIFLQIWIDGFYVGGCDDFYVFDCEGRLDGLFQGVKVSL